MPLKLTWRCSGTSLERSILSSARLWLIAGRSGLPVLPDRRNRAAPRRACPLAAEVWIYMPATHWGLMDLHKSDGLPCHNLLARQAHILHLAFADIASDLFSQRSLYIAL